MAYYIEFQPLGLRCKCNNGETILDCARRAGVSIVNSCGGASTCGTCRVQTISGSFTDITYNETSIFNEEEIKQGWRLSCKTRPLSDSVLKVPPESLATLQRVQVEGMAICTEPHPAVAVCDVRLSPPSINDQLADAERLIAAIDKDMQIAVDYGILKELPSCLRENNWKIRAAVRGKEIIGIIPGNEPLLGFAADLGTTKIAGYLVDLVTGRTLASKGIMNPQIAYGGDVIARLSRAMKNSAEAELMQRLAADTLNRLAHELCEETNHKTASIADAVIVANTAMHHLLLKLPVHQLAQAPYVPAVQSALNIKAREIGLSFATGAYAHILPNIAGYVGADHVAMILATNLADAKDNILALDIGTNTEICLSNKGDVYSASCASGPAFEGAHIKHGMFAAEGAIEYVSISGNAVKYSVIGNTDPEGICGSGILDALAQLYTNHIVDSSGRMGNHALVRTVNGVREFVIAEKKGRAISVTQNDVRELQKAKAAIQTGIQILLERCSLKSADLDRIIIAGAFGSYIDIASAKSIGMLPDLESFRFSQVGNAAGTGARMALVSEFMREKAQDIARRVKYIELAAHPSFMRIYTDSLNLGAF